MGEALGLLVRPPAGAPDATGESPGGLGASRYRRGVPANPQGASIDALEICNEPNYLAWPQEGIVEAVAQMIRSATTLSHIWGGTPILAPATSDFPDSTRRSSLGIRDTIWSE